MILKKSLLLEGIILKKGSRIQEITLYDLRNSDITSDTTKIFKKARQSKESNGLANKNTKFIESSIVGNDILFKFLTEASKFTAVRNKVTGEIKEVPYPEDHVYQRVIPGTSTLENNPSATYEIWIKVLDVLGKDGWLSVYDPEKETITGEMIKSIVEVADVKIYDDDPSFLLQGFSYWLTQLDAGIFPENRKPKRWNLVHSDGNSFLPKHLSGLIDQLPFFLNQMASSLTNLLRQEGIIPEYTRPNKRKSRA